MSHSAKLFNLPVLPVMGMTVDSEILPLGVKGTLKTELRR